jgi:hypothetical protein
MPEFGEGFFGRMVSLMNTQAQTNLINQEAADYQALTQERQLNLQQMRLKQAHDQQRQQILSQISSGQIGTNFRGDQPVQGDPLMGNLDRELQQSQQEVQQYRGLAQIMRQNQLYDAADEYDKKADTAMQKSTGVMTQKREYQKQVNGEIAAAAGPFVDNPSAETFAPAWQFMASKYPLLVRDVPRDTNGVPDWRNPETQSIMKHLASMGESREQQLQDKSRAEQELIRKANEARQEKKDAEEEKERKVRMDREAAQTKLDLARTKDIEDKAKERADRQEKLDKSALIAPNPKQVEQTKESIKAAFPGRKWDESLEAFAGDVAARAKKIQAESFRTTGQEMSLDDAREQAIDELSSKVQKPEHRGGGWTIPLTGVTVLEGLGGEDVTSYRRGGVTAPAKSAPAGNVDTNGSLDAARAAIKAGADRAAVEKRLRDNGIDPKGL